MPTDPVISLAEARRLAGSEAWVPLCREYDRIERGTPPEPSLAVILAEAQMRVGDPRLARELLREALPEFEHVGDTITHCRACNMLGAAHFELGDLDRAEKAFALVLERASAIRSDLLVARSTNNLGLIANIQKRHDEAIGQFHLAAAAFQQAGNTAGLAETHHNIAIAYRDLEQWDQAEKAERRAIEYSSEAGNHRLLAMAQTGRAELKLLYGEAEVAEAGASLAADTCRAIPDPVGEADALRLVAAARLSLGELQEAKEPVDRAVVLARRHGSALVEAEALRVRARLLAVQGNSARARGDAQEAVALYARLGAESDRDSLEAWLRRAFS